jgi:hypothetical protein
LHTARSPIVEVVVANRLNVNLGGRRGRGRSGREARHR